MVRKLTAAKKQEMMNQFKQFDKSGDGKLNFKEMSQLLRKGNPKLEEDELMNLFQGADVNGDGAVDFDEFVAHVYGEKPPEITPAPAALQEKFKEFAGDKMDSREFNKLIIDCGLINKSFPKQQVDTTFTKVKERGTRDIDYNQFVKALNLVATARGEDANKIFEMVMAGAKSSSGTVGDAVRFHDDKSTYTGAHTFNEKNMGDQAPGGEYGEARHARIQAAEDSHAGGADADWSGVEKVYRLYDKDNNGLDNREFDKILGDCNLFNKTFKKNDSAIVFNKALSKGQRKITVEEFKEALRKIADKRMSSTQEVQEMVMASTGPSLSGVTQAEKVRFHDDKSTYTGAHVFNEAHGATANESEEERHKRIKAAAGEHDVGPEGPWDDIERVYKAYAQDMPNQGMSSREFKKVMEDTGVIDKQFPLTHLDTVFAACKDGKIISLDGFKESMRRIAGKKSMAIQELQTQIGSSDGPILNATKAEYSRFHDDKDTYTGTHAGK
jgi:Ca2+-binding EF-hand superfamily protein